MENYKTEILEKICYTELVYGRINKKLGAKLSKYEIEKMVHEVIMDTNIINFEKIGKNVYVINKNKNIRLTINSYTNRIITVDKFNKIKRLMAKK